jgi:hypothetical protein
VGAEEAKGYARRAAAAANTEAMGTVAACKRLPPPHCPYDEKAEEEDGEEEAT